MPLIATCHCQGTTLEVSAPPTEVTACNCTFCSKRGVVWAYYAPDQVAVRTTAHRGDYLRDADIHHYFCAQCGCGTYSDTPTWSETGEVDPARRRFGINARLFDDFDLAAVPVKHLDGRNQW